MKPSVLAVAGLGKKRGGAPSGPLDDFERADAATLGPNWVEVVGSWSIDGGKAKLPQETGISYQVYWDTSLGADHFAELVYDPWGTGEVYPGVMVRKNNDAVESYIYARRQTMTGKWEIGSRTAGANVTLKSLTDSAPADGATMRLTAVGQLLTLHVDGVFKCAALSTDHLGNEYAGIHASSGVVPTTTRISEFGGGVALPAAGAFPFVRDVRSSIGTGGSYWTVPIPQPTVEAGDLILLTATQDTDWPVISAAPAGYTELAQRVVSGQVACIIYGKVADGTESGNVSFGTSGYEEFAVHSLSIGNWSGVLGDVEATTNEGGGTSMDAPSHTPTGGAQDYLWLAMVGHDNGGRAVSGNPDGFLWSHYQNNANTGGCGEVIGVAHINAATLDPTPWTMTTGDNWAGFTVSVPPAGS